MKALFSLLAVLLLAVRASGEIRPITPRAPEFPEGHVWINAKPLKFRILKNRRAVVVAFINTVSINSLRTLEVLKEWHRRYALHGLMLIGVHTPEYIFQNDPLAARRAIERLGLEFPIVLDPKRKIWEAFGNTGWPALYLINHKGKIIYDRVGEGGYSRFERELREALKRVPRQKPAQVKKTVADLPTENCHLMSPETYAGSKRGSPIDSGKAAPGSSALRLRAGQISFAGPWKTTSDSLILQSSNKLQLHSVSMVYTGAQAFALLGSPKPARFMVLQNERWLHFGNAGDDIDFDEDGKSFVEVGEPRLFHLTKNEFNDYFELTLKPQKSGGEVYSFAFSDWCLKDIYPGGE